MAISVNADERAFQMHMERPDFQVAVLKGRWRVLRIAWPHVDIGVRARDGLEWGFRFLLDGYPARLPNAKPCAIETGAPLPGTLWPKGLGRFSAVFNPNWNQAALYLPCDRLALPGHDQWVTQLPEMLWPPLRGIIHYLEILYDLLNSSAYCPPVRPAA
jgi:hypothetical protein